MLKTEYLGIRLKNRIYVKKNEKPYKTYNSDGGIEFNYFDQGIDELNKFF